MPVTRVRQLLALIRPTARAVAWGPLAGAAILATLYVLKEAPNAFITYRILVLRVAALLLCMGAAFVLDDPTEESLGYVPTPLLLRRLLRVGLLLPLLAGAWGVLVHLAGDVSRRDGGPMPVADLTLEVATVVMVALAASSVGARLTSDRLGGIAAAPLVLGIVGAAMLLPYRYRLIVSSASDPRWADAHDLWQWAFVAAVAVFLYVNRAPSIHRAVSRVRSLHPSAGAA